MLPTGLIGVNYMAGFNLKNLITSLDKMEKDYTNDQFSQYPRQKSYIVESDWEVNT